MKHNLKFGTWVSLFGLSLLLFNASNLQSQCVTTRAGKVVRSCLSKPDTIHIPKITDFVCEAGLSVTNIVAILPQVSVNGTTPCDSTIYSKSIRTWSLTVKNIVGVTIRTEQYTDTVCFTKSALFPTEGIMDTVPCPRDTIIYCPIIGSIDTSIFALGAPISNSSIPCNILQTGPIRKVWVYKSNGCYKISRTWDLLDWCTKQTKTCTQVIEVRDTFKPVISTMALLIPDVSVSGDQCTASFILPPIAAGDNCSSQAQLVYSVTVDGVTINTNGGLISGIHIGTHEVMYKVDDGCGNISTFITSVTVYDGVPPLALCKGPKVVQLPQSGMVTLPKSAFDDGSFDRCTHDISIKIRRMNDLPACHNAGNPFNRFDDNVKFCCVDAGTDVMVIMRVSQNILPPGPISIDTYTKLIYTDCMVAVKVVDKFGPDITCPEGITIDCRDISKKRVKHPSDYGMAVINEMCLDSVKFDSIPSLSECGIGFIIRRITAKDKAGNSTSCDQLIKVVNNSPFNANDTSDFIWPKDTTFFVCSANTAPSVTGMPVVKDPSCAKVIFNHSDEVYEFAPGACKKILRKWSVVDWCQVDPVNPSVGKWVRTQKIVVMDTVKPVLTVPADIVSSNTDSVCGPKAITIPLPTATDCTAAINLEWSFIVDFFNDGLDLKQGVGRDASQSFPNGIHSIEFKVNDKCGNYSVKKIKVTVVDGKKPTPVVMHGLATDLSRMNGVGMVRVFARQFFLFGSTFDNCTPFDKLRFSFSSNVNDTVRSYTCDSMGIRNVRLFITDEANNQDNVLSYILIQNNMNACTSPDPAPGLRTAGVEGKIANEAGKAIEQVSIKIMNGSSILPDVNVANGKFNSTSLFLGESYDIIPKKDINPTNGVSTVDLIVMQRHILGIKPLPTPYKMIAADIDKNKEIDALDLIELRKLILGIDTKFSNNESWRFVDESFRFKDLQNALKEPFREKYPIVNMDRSMQANFIGVKIGDVNESSLPNELMELENRTAEINDIKLTDATVGKDQTVKVPIIINAPASIHGLQFKLQLSGLTYQGIESAEFNSNEVHGHFRDNILKISIASGNARTVNNAPLFYLVLHADQEVKLSKALSLVEDNAFASEVYNYKLTASQLKLNWSSTEFKLYPNRPNPFADITVVDYYMPAESPVSLKIIDLQGRVLSTQRKTANKGINQWSITQDLFKAAGIYYYRIESVYGVYSNKMILVK